MRRFHKAVLLTCAAFYAFVISADEDVKYRSKSFSGKSLESRSYSAKSYKSEKVLRDQQYKESSKKTGGFWSIFGLGKKKEYSVLPKQEQQKSKDYQCDERSTLKIEHPEERALSGEKSLDNTPEVKNKDYKPSDIKRGHDPLLAPRQGIKAPVAENGK